MATVQRANVILDVADDPAIIQRYKDKGYDVIDSRTGLVIEKAMPQDTGAMRARIVELERELEARDKDMQDLVGRVAELRKQINELQKVPKEQKTVKKASTTKKS